jgi:hypothetical protein
VKPKSLCNSIAHRSFPAQNHIQVSAINAVVLRKRDLTTFVLDSRSQQINYLTIVKYKLLPAQATGLRKDPYLITGPGRQGVHPNARSHRRSGLQRIYRPMTFFMSPASPPQPATKFCSVNWAFFFRQKYILARHPVAALRMRRRDPTASFVTYLPFFVIFNLGGDYQLTLIPSSQNR